MQTHAATRLPAHAFWGLDGDLWLNEENEKKKKRKKKRRAIFNLVSLWEALVKIRVVNLVRFTTQSSCKSRGIYNLDFCSENSEL